MKNTKKSKRGGSQKVYCVLKWISRGKERKNRADAMCEVIMAENYSIHQTD